jgi:hypothetical protein
MLQNIQEIQSLATKYSVAQLKNLADLKLIDPIKAVMAGNMIRHIQEQNSKPPETTVAQDLLGIQGSGTGTMAGTTLGMQGQQLGPTAPQPQEPQPQQMAQAPSGMESLPAGDVGNYAGGGIIAFGDGGDVPKYGEGGFRFPQGSILGMFQNNELPGQASSAARNNENLQYIEQELQRPNLSDYDRRRLEQGRAALINSTAASYPSEATRGSASFTRPVTTPTDTNPFNTPNDRNALPPVRSERAAPRASAMPPSTPVEPPKLGEFDPNAVKIKGGKLDMPTVSDLATIKGEREAGEAAEGYNKNLTADQIKRIEGKQNELADLKSRAGGEALMNFGLGLIGAKKGEEAQKIGESGKAALSAYKNDVKDLRSAKEKLEERAEALRVAENQAKKTDSAADRATRDKMRDKFDAAKLAEFNAENELAKTGVLASAHVYNTKEQVKAHNYSTAQQRESAKEGHQIQLQVGQLAHTASMYNANVIKQGNLDNARTKMLIDASDSFIKNYAGSTTYMQNPQLLQQDAMAYAQRLAEKFGVNVPGNQPATAAAPTGNLPPLNSDKYRTRQ